MTNFVAFGTPYVKIYVIYFHVCMCIHQRWLLCNIMLIVLLEWSLWAFGSEITPVSRNQHRSGHYESFDMENSLWLGCSHQLKDILVVAASKYWIPAALSIFWNNLQKTRCLSPQHQKFFLCLLVFLFVSVQETMNHTKAQTLS